MNLREEVEQYYGHFRQHNPLFVAAREGTVNREQMAVYVRNLHYLFSSSTKLAARAEIVSKTRHLSDLAAFFSTKVQEETGHEKWAEEDLKHFDSNSPSEANEIGA